jgi:hypothetical protein
MRQLCRFFAFTGPLAILTLAAHADPFDYSFSWEGNTFSVDEPELLTSETYIPAASLLSTNIAGLVSAEINPTGSGCFGFIVAACVYYVFAGQVQPFFFSGPLTSVGTYDGEGAHLTITDLAAPPPPPIPTDTFNYSFSNGVNSFSIDEPALLTSDTTIYPGDVLSTNIASLEYIEIDPAGGECHGLGVGFNFSCVAYTFPNGQITETTQYYFLPKLSSPGTYTSAAPGGGTLVITDIPPVPEPSTIVLFGTGLADIVQTYLRRRAPNTRRIRHD